MKINSIDLELLKIAESFENLSVHHQPKKDNRRWGVRRDDFIRSTAWIEPKVRNNEFVVKPTGDFTRFAPQLESISQRTGGKNPIAYYFKMDSVTKVFGVLSGS